MIIKFESTSILSERYISTEEAKDNFTCIMFLDQHLSKVGTIDFGSF